MSQKPNDHLEEVLTKARQRLNGAAGLAFPTEALHKDEAKVTSPTTTEEAPAAESPSADEPGRRDDRDQG